MNLSDIFSLPTLICLGITVLLVGLVSVFFMQRMNEQNHKIASMLGLVSTMADELNFVRSRVQILSSNMKFNSGGGPEFNENESKKNNSVLIPVSDDENSDEDSTVDNDSESDNDESDNDESDNDDDEDTEGSESESDDNEGHTEDIANSNNIKTINMGETLDINILSESIENDEEDNGESSIDDDIESLNEVDLENDGENDLEQSTTNEILANEKFTLTNTDFIKSIDMSSLEDHNNSSESFDYKKMSLPKLRSIVSEKGLSTDSSKLKKNELLKLLDSE
jgi:hypothetical protein